MLHFVQIQHHQKHQCSQEGNDHANPTRSIPLSGIFHKARGTETHISTFNPPHSMFRKWQQTITFHNSQHISQYLTAFLQTQELITQPNFRARLLSKWYQLRSKSHCSVILGPHGNCWWSKGQLWSSKHQMNTQAEGRKEGREGDGHESERNALNRKSHKPKERNKLQHYRIKLRGRIAVREATCKPSHSWPLLSELRQSFRDTEKPSPSIWSPSIHCCWCSTPLTHLPSSCLVTSNYAPSDPLSANQLPFR